MYSISRISWNFLIFWTIFTTSIAVTVNYRNSSLFGSSLADRIVLANQQKLQSHIDASHQQLTNVVITTTTSATTTQPVTAKPTVPSDGVSNSVNTENSPKSKWCNVTVFKKSRVTWLSAYRTCKRFGNGTELASIKTKEDYDTFVQNVKDAGSPASVIYWTSGTDVLDEGEFVWMADGTEVTQTWWAPGQPDNHWDMEHCIAFKRYTNETSYKMTDENCLLAGAFICTQPCKFWV